MPTKFRKMKAKIAQISVGSCHGNQIWAKISQNCTKTIFCKKSRNFKHVNTGLLNSNMLPDFSTQPRESPWQPKLCKNKPKFRRIQFSNSYGDNVCVCGKVFFVGEFKYANKNFRRAKGVAIATKFIQKGQKCTDFSSVRNTVPISTYMSWVSGL